MDPDIINDVFDHVLGHKIGDDFEPANVEANGYLLNGFANADGVWQSDKFSLACNGIAHKCRMTNQRFQKHTTADILASIKFETEYDLQEFGRQNRWRRRVQYSTEMPMCVQQESQEPHSTNRLKSSQVPDTEHVETPSYTYQNGTGNVVRFNVDYIKEELRRVNRVDRAITNAEGRTIRYGWTCPDTAIQYNNPFDPRITFNGLAHCCNKPPLADLSFPTTVTDTFNCVLDEDNPTEFTNNYLNSYRQYIHDLTRDIVFHVPDETPPAVTETLTQTNTFPPFVDETDESRQLWERILATKRFWSDHDDCARHVGVQNHTKSETTGILKCKDGMPTAVRFSDIGRDSSARNKATSQSYSGALKTSLQIACSANDLPDCTTPIASECKVNTTRIQHVIAGGKAPQTSRVQLEQLNRKQDGQNNLNDNIDKLTALSDIAEYVTRSSSTDHVYSEGDVQSFLVSLLSCTGDTRTTGDEVAVVAGTIGCQADETSATELEIKSQSARIGKKSSQRNEAYTTVAVPEIQPVHMRHEPLPLEKDDTNNDNLQYLVNAEYPSSPYYPSPSTSMFWSHHQRQQQQQKQQQTPIQSQPQLLPPPSLQRQEQQQHQQQYQQHKTKKQHHQKQNQHNYYRQQLSTPPPSQQEYNQKMQNYYVQRQSTPPPNRQKHQQHTQKQHTQQQQQHTQQITQQQHTQQQQQHTQQHTQQQQQQKQQQNHQQQQAQQQQCYYQQQPVANMAPLPRQQWYQQPTPMLIRNNFGLYVNPVHVVGPSQPLVPPVKPFNHHHQQQQQHQSQQQQYDHVTQQQQPDRISSLTNNRSVPFNDAGVSYTPSVLPYENSSRHVHQPNVTIDDEVWYINGIPHHHSRPENMPKLTPNQYHTQETLGLVATNDTSVNAWPPSSNGDKVSQPLALHDVGMRAPTHASTSTNSSIHRYQSNDGRRQESVRTPYGSFVNNNQNNSNINRSYFKGTDQCGPSKGLSSDQISSETCWRNEGTKVSYSSNRISSENSDRCRSNGSDRSSSPSSYQSSDRISSPCSYQSSDRSDSPGSDQISERSSSQSSFKSSDVSCSPVIYPCRDQSSSPSRNQVSSDGESDCGIGINELTGDIRESDSSTGRSTQDPAGLYGNDSGSTKSEDKYESGGSATIKTDVCFDEHEPQEGKLTKYVDKQDYTYFAEKAASSHSSVLVVRGYGSQHSDNDLGFSKMTGKKIQVLRNNKATTDRERIVKKKPRQIRSTLVQLV